MGFFPTYIFVNLNVYIYGYDFYRYVFTMQVIFCFRLKYSMDM